MTRANRMRDAQSFVRVSRATVEQMTNNGATVHYLPAQIHSHAGSYSASAYIASAEDITEDIAVEDGLFLNEGDYVIVATMGNNIWVDRVYPSLYSRIAFDYTNKRLYLGNGIDPPGDTGDDGQVLTSGGPGGSLSWQDGSGVSTSVPIDTIIISNGEMVVDEDGGNIVGNT